MSTITSASAQFSSRDSGMVMTIGQRRYVHPWWAMFGHWEQDEAPIVAVTSATTATLGRPVRRKRKLDWQR